MLILNFSHELTHSQRAQIRALTGKRLSRIKEYAVQFDDQQSFTDQLQALMSQIPLSYLQSPSLLVNLPSLNYIAAGVLAYLHAIRGHFPPVVVLRPVPGSLGEFEVTEILYLQEFRDIIRPQRFIKTTETQP